MGGGEGIECRPDFCPSPCFPHVLQTSHTPQSGLWPLFSGGGEVPPSRPCLLKSTDELVLLDHAGGQNPPLPPILPWCLVASRCAAWGIPQDLAPDPKSPRNVRVIHFQGPGCLRSPKKRGKSRGSPGPLGNLRQLLGLRTVSEAPLQSPHSHFPFPSLWSPWSLAWWWWGGGFGKERPARVSSGQGLDFSSTPSWAVWP